MKSIRVTLTIGAALILAAGIGILLLCSTLFLEPYYALQTKKAFLGVQGKMMARPRDPRSELALVRTLVSETGFKIVAVNRDGLVRLSSAPEFVEGQRFPLPKEQLAFFQSHRERMQNGESFFGILDATPRGQSVLQLQSSLDPDNFLVVTQPLDQFRRGIKAAYSFFLLTGSLVLVVAFIITLILTGSIARPIMELSRTAHRIAAGDLKARHARTREDELGDLGDSLNAMASSLARNIDALTAANEELAKKIKGQEAFIAGASHELKTPVGLVRGYAEALKLGMSASETEREEFVDVILKESDHLGRLVNDLALITELRDAEFPLALAPGDLYLTISEAAARFILPAHGKRVSVDVTGEGPILMRYDPDRMVQVMDNLMSNAVRHTPEGGSITVRIGASSGRAILEVENTGEAIPESDRENLFEPFYRADKSRSRKHGGMGLGLTIVKTTVQAHGGACDVRNSPHGVIFRVTLPLSAAH